MANHRKERVAELLMCFLGEQLCRLDDSRLHMVTITAVYMSADLRSARVYWSTTVPEGVKKPAYCKELAEGLKHVSKYLQHRIGSELQLRFIPRLNFEYDESLDNGQRIEELLQKVKSHVS